MEKLGLRSRILLVEDEVLIAMLLEDYLTELGQQVAGHADSVDAALALLASDPAIDFAFLDMNLRGDPVDSVADALAARGTPFCIMTGYGAAGVAAYPDGPILTKPFDLASVRNAISRALSRAPRRLIDTG